MTVNSESRGAVQTQPNAAAMSGDVVAETVNRRAVREPDSREGILNGLAPWRADLLARERYSWADAMPLERLTDGQA